MEVEYRCLVRNIPAGTTSDVLEQTFEKYGSIFQVQVWPAKQRYTIGFVTFHKKEDMDAAINGTNLIGQTQLGVSVVVVTKLVKTKVVVNFLSSSWETNQKNYVY
ncbi:hypothetical protein MKX03_024407 [Papaver bracteatum]|nr:hypothetical protein MKX03_024407 [Papaver bracteatum]